MNKELNEFGYRELIKALKNCDNEVQEALLKELRRL